MHVSRRIPLLEKSGQLEIEELGQGTRASTYRLPRAPEPRSVNTTWTQEQGRQDPVASTSQGRSVNIGDPVASTSAAATPLILEQVEEEQREQGGPPAKHETTPAIVDPPTPAWSADDYLAAFVAWVRAKRNPTYALTPETRRELREHLAGCIADGLDPTAIAAGLKEWFTDHKRPGPIALSRHIDKAQRDPHIAIAYWAWLHKDEEDPAVRADREDAERAERLVKALEAEGAIHVGGGQWQVPEGVIPNPKRAVEWLAARGVTVE